MALLVGMKRVSSNGEFCVVGAGRAGAWRAGVRAGMLFANFAIALGLRAFPDLCCQPLRPSLVGGVNWLRPGRVSCHFTRIPNQDHITFAG